MRSSSRRCYKMIVSVVLIGSSSAFSPPPTCAIASLQHSRRSCSVHLTHQSSMLLPRRAASLYSFFLGALLVVVPKESRAAFDADDERLLAGYATLVDLIENWGKYAGKGEEANGDNVRRQVRAAYAFLKFAVRYQFVSCCISSLGVHKFCVSYICPRFQPAVFY